jgi:hypothetical protein
MMSGVLVFIFFRFHIPISLGVCRQANVASHVLQQKGEPAMFRLKATAKGIALHDGHWRLVEFAMEFSFSFRFSVCH